MKYGWILLALLATGCATGSNAPAPMFYNGNYYLAAGDPNCALFRKHDTSSLIQCYTANKEDRGPRRPMTDQEMANYQQMQAQLRIQRQIATEQALVDLRTRNNLVQPIQYPTMQVPQVTPLPMPGGNQVRCITAGIYTNCRY